MKPEEVKIDLWRAFFLGVRASLVAHEIGLSNRSLKTAVDKMFAVARGDETIYDPVVDAGFFGKPEELTNRLHIAFRSDRELAQEIAEGFDEISK